MSADARTEPVEALRVVRGHADDAEVAVLTVLVAALPSGATRTTGAAGAAAGRTPSGRWADPRRALNPGARHGWAG